MAALASPAQDPFIILNGNRRREAEPFQATRSLHARRFRFRPLADLVKLFPDFSVSPFHRFILISSMNSGAGVALRGCSPSINNPLSADPQHQLHADRGAMPVSITSTMTTTCFSALARSFPAAASASLASATQADRSAAIAAWLPVLRWMAIKRSALRLVFARSTAWRTTEAGNGGAMGWMMPVSAAWRWEKGRPHYPRAVLISAGTFAVELLERTPLPDFNHRSARDGLAGRPGLRGVERGRQRLEGFHGRRLRLRDRSRQSREIDFGRKFIPGGVAGSGFVRFVTPAASFCAAFSRSASETGPDIGAVEVDA